MLFEARISIFRFEYWFKAKNISNDSDRLEIVELMEDSQTKKFFDENKDIKTWRQFKGRILKYAQKALWMETIRLKQKAEEPTADWLRKIIPIIKQLDISREEKSKIILYTSYEDTNFNYIQIFFNDC